MQTFTTLHTNGRGYWSSTAKAVEITQLRLQYCNPEKEFGELCVYFSPTSWDINKDGLIYTDKQFRAELHAYLQTIGFTLEEATDVNYSEQGMQSAQYVSFDVGSKFIAGLERLDPTHFTSIWAGCLYV
jgi:hypothetical protein